MNKKTQEILINIEGLLKKICEANQKYADVIINEINSPLIKSISFHKNNEGMLIVKFLSSLSHLNDYSMVGTELDYKCELKISDCGFQYEKTSITKNNTYKYTLRCKNNLEITDFSRETFHEYKSTINYGVPYSTIKASNEIDRFNRIQQLSHEENKVDITCLPSRKGKMYVKKALDKHELAMSVTNSFALELLNRLNYDVLSVKSNRSECSQIWPILENSVIQLVKKESINWDNDWDAYYNEEIMFVGDNKYESHKNLDVGAMYYTYNEEEREIAQKYFDGIISIEEVLNTGKQILLNYEKKPKHNI